MGTGAQEAFTTTLTEAMIDAADSAIVALDTSGRVVRWNRAAAALTGISAAEMRSRMFSEIVWPEDRDRWLLEFRRMISDNKPSLFEIRWKQDKGGFAPMTCSCSAVHGPESGLRYVVCTANRSISQAAMSDRTAEFQEISRFVHDTITQDLVALSFQMSIVGDSATEAAFRQEAQDSLLMIERCCRHVRVISSLLSSPSLEGITLKAGIEQEAAFLGEEAGLDIALDLDPIGNEVAPEAQSLMFVAVKAWLSRSVWSRAQPRILIRLRSPHNGGAVLGMEMTPPGVIGSVQGWSVVHERAKALGGEFSIEGDTQRFVASLSFPGQATA